MSKHIRLLVPLVACAIAVPLAAHGSVESTMDAIQGKLTGTLLPAAAVLGLIFAGFSYVSGNANARSHLVYAIVGAIVGFGAQSIVDLIRSLVH